MKYVIVVWRGPQKVELTDELAEIYDRLVDAIRDVFFYTPKIVFEDTKRYVILNDAVDYAFHYAALALQKAEAPDDEIMVDVPDLFVALAVRGILRVIGIHAKIRIRPEGGTKKEDLWKARDRLSLLSSLAFYD